jgi:hypothetical protein
LVEVEEWIYRKSGCNYLRVLAPRMGVTNRGRSRRLERALTDFGAEHSFAKANARLAEHYGFSLHASTVRAVTLHHAQRAQAHLAAGYAESFRALPAQGATHVVAEADGTMICTVPRARRGAARPRNWREMRLVAARAQGRVESTYGATFAEVDVVGRRWGHCARTAGWGLNSQLHIVADGAEWIERQSQEVFAEQGRFLLDFFHASEYLAAAAQTCAPKTPARWRHTQQRRLRRGAAAKVLGALAQDLEPVGTPDEQAPVRAARRYLDRRRDHLDYPRALALDLPIGSGLIESGNRHVLQSRLKQPGTAWLEDHAESIAQLRVLRANHLWTQFWN